MFKIVILGSRSSKQRGIFHSNRGMSILALADNVLFFNKKPAAKTPWTRKLWICDLRTNLHFTLKTGTLKRKDLGELVACCSGASRGHWARVRL